MAKSAEDLALLLGAIMRRDFTAKLVASWSGQKVSFVNPALWELSPLVCVRNPELLKKQVRPSLLTRKLLT